MNTTEEIHEEDNTALYVGIVISIITLLMIVVGAYYMMINNKSEGENTVAGTEEATTETKAETKAEPETEAERARRQKIAQHAADVMKHRPADAPTSVADMSVIGNPGPCPPGSWLKDGYCAENCSDYKGCSGGRVRRYAGYFCDYGKCY